MTVAAALQTGAGIVTAPLAGAATSALMNPASRGITQAANEWWRNNVPSESMLMAAWRARTIDQRLFERMMGLGGIPAGRMRGITAPFNYADDLPNALAWQSVFDATLTVPSPGELVLLLNRNKLAPDVFDKYLKRNGVNEPEVREAYIELGKVLPGPSDLVSFALREAWDPAVVERFRYDAEYPAELGYWMEKQGANGDARTNVPQLRDTGPVTWSQMYWRVHWANLAPTQAYEMFQRLRPNRIARFAGVFPGIRAFTLSDLRQVLKINDYPQPFRDQLAAIAYRVPRLVDLQRYYALGIVDEAELTESHLDVGFDPTNAQRRTDFVVSFTRRQEYKAATGNLKSAIVEAYRLGAIDKSTAALLLYKHLYYGLPDTTRFLALTPAGQGREALGDDAIAAILNDAERKDLVESIKAQLASLKKRYILGIIDVNLVRNEMQSLGILARKIDVYLSRWDLLKSGTHVYFSTSRIVKLTGDGLFSVDNAKIALHNLGWDEQATAMLLAEAGNKYRKLLQAKADQVTRSQKQRQADLLRAAREAKKQAGELFKELNRQSSPSQLRRRYVKGVITRDQYAFELARRGFEAGPIADMLREADIDRSDELARRRCKDIKDAQPCKPAKAVAASAGSTALSEKTTAKGTVTDTIKVTPPTPGG